MFAMLPNIDGAEAFPASTVGSITILGSCPISTARALRQRWFRISFRYVEQRAIVGLGILRPVVAGG